MKISKLFLITFVVMFLTSATNNVNAQVQNPDTTSNLLVVPNTYTALAGTNVFIGPIASTPRTYQLLIHEDQLSDFVGRDLSGVGFRLPTSANADWPLIDAVIASYDIYLSESVTPADRSLTFALNVVGTQTQVRSGNLSIPIGSYRFGENPNSFGPIIEFSSAYTYTGGHLLIEIRHSGHSATSRSVDAIGTAVSGYGTQFSACWGSGQTATSGSQGNFSVTAIIADDLVGIVGNSETPSEYNLQQNFPNPFNPSTLISFSIPEVDYVTLKVFNSLGQEVALLVNNQLTPGNYDFTFDAISLTSGVYFYELTAGEFKETKRMLLVK